MIKLNIKRFVNNDQYEAEMADYKDRSRYVNTRINNDDYPRKEIEQNILEVFITEEQFEAIRKSALEVF